MWWMRPPPRRDGRRCLEREAFKPDDRWVLATKFQNPMDPKDPNSGGGGRKWIAYEIDASLARLKTHIDVYYLHRDDIETPLEETVDAMGTLIREGKIRYWAVSNFAGWRISELLLEAAGTVDFHRARMHPIGRRT